MTLAAPDLTVSQVASALTCSKKTVLRLARAGDLRGYKLGRVWRFTAAEVDAFRRRHHQAEPFIPQKPRVRARAGGHLAGWYDYDHGGRPS